MLPADLVKMRRRVINRIHVDRVTGCWNTDGYRRPDGYGEMDYEGQKWLLHRAAHVAFVGLIPDGLDIDHLCRNRACANPKHLEPVTRAENLRRGVMWNSLKTHCPQGHPYEGDNLKVALSGKKNRWCRQCHREANRRLSLRKKEASCSQPI